MARVSDMYNSKLIWSKHTEMIPSQVMTPEATEEEEEEEGGKKTKQGMKVGSSHWNGPEGGSPRCRKTNPIIYSSSFHKIVAHIWLSWQNTDMVNKSFTCNNNLVSACILIEEINTWNYLEINWSAAFRGQYQNVTTYPGLGHSFVSAGPLVQGMGKS